MTDNELQKNIYQFIITRLNGDQIGSKSYQKEIIGLVEKGIGGFILFGGEKRRIAKFIKKLQSLAEIPLLIASDIERGVGQQVKGTTMLPFQMALAAAINEENEEDIELLKKIINAIAFEAIDIGINMPLIPVLDVNQNPDNPIICTRAFSDNEKTVSWFGSLFIELLRGYGLVSCAKHFPGHGDTSVDSHISLPEIRKSKDDLLRKDIYPFISAIRKGVDSIMVGHLLVPALSFEPSTLSKEIIKDFLRDELGFRGIIVSDALNMHAIRGIKNVYLRCFKAGIDLLLHPVDPHEAVKELTYGLENGEIRTEEIRERLARIKGIKSKIKNIPVSEFSYEDNRKLSEVVTERSITLYKGDSRFFPVNNSEEVSIFFIGEKDMWKDCVFKTYIKGDVDRKTEKVIIAIFTNVSAWKGSHKIKDSEIGLIKEIIKKYKLSCVVSFGNPYILRHFHDADVLIAAYDTSENAQRAVVKALKGEIDFRGKSPVNINL